jgi:hypothetical protein
MVATFCLRSWSAFAAATYERTAVVGIALMVILFVVVLQKDVVNIVHGTVLPGK